MGIRILKTFISFLLPSYGQTTGDKTKSRTLGQSALEALDGLRGLACIIIFHGHICHSLGQSMFWASTWDAKPYFFQYPWVHYFFNGRGNVWVLFVISGYAMALKPLKLAYDRDGAKFNEAMGSSVVRRGFRLYLPAMVALCLIGLMTWLGILDPARRVRYHPTKENYLDLLEDIPPQLSFGAQLESILKACWELFDIFTLNNGHLRIYNAHYWALPAQLRASLLVYLALLAGYRLNPRYRTLFFWSLTILSHRPWQRADMISHFGGVALADLDVKWAQASVSVTVSKDKEGQLLPMQSTSPGARQESKFFTHLCWIAFIVGWLFLSIPLIDRPHQVLTHYITQNLPYLDWEHSNDGIDAVGAILFVFSILQLPQLQFWMNTNIMAYLGRISYSLYLTHGVVLRALLWAMLPYLYGTAGITGPLRLSNVTKIEFLVVWSLSIALTISPVIVIADIFYRFVEEPALKVTLWIDRQLSEQPKT